MPLMHIRKGIETTIQFFDEEGTFYQASKPVFEKTLKHIERHTVAGVIFVFSNYLKKHDPEAIGYIFLIFLGGIVMLYSMYLLALDQKFLTQKVLELVTWFERQEQNLHWVLKWLLRAISIPSLFILWWFSTIGISMMFFLLLLAQIFSGSALSLTDP